MSTSIGVYRPASKRIQIICDKLRELVEVVEDDMSDRAQSGEIDETLERVVLVLRRMERDLDAIASDVQIGIPGRARGDKLSHRTEACLSVALRNPSTSPPE